MFNAMMIIFMNICMLILVIFLIHILEYLIVSHEQIINNFASENLNNVPKNTLQKQNKKQPFTLNSQTERKLETEIKHVKKI